jgi:hypothetical protein
MVLVLPWKMLLGFILAVGLLTFGWRFVIVIEWRGGRWRILGMRRIGTFRRGYMRVLIRVMRRVGWNAGEGGIVVEGNVRCVGSVVRCKVRRVRSV